MSASKDRGKSMVQRVSSFEELFSKSASEQDIKHYTHDGNRNSMLVEDLYPSIDPFYSDEQMGGDSIEQNLEDFSNHDLEYINSLLNTECNQQSSQDIFEDPYDFYTHSYTVNGEESTAGCAGILASSKKSLGCPVKKAQCSLERAMNKINDLHEWPLSFRDQMESPLESKKSPSQESMDYNEATKHKRVMENEKYYQIYRQYTGIKGFKARYRIKGKLTDDIKSMLDSKDEKMIRKACHFLGCRDPNDLLTSDETSILITRLVLILDVTRKHASSIIKMGSISFPIDKKDDLLSNDWKTFSKALKVLYQNYGKANAIRARKTRATKKHIDEQQQYSKQGDGQ